MRRPLWRRAPLCSQLQTLRLQATVWARAEKISCHSTVVVRPKHAHSFYFLPRICSCRARAPAFTGEPHGLRPTPDARPRPPPTPPDTTSRRDRERNTAHTSETLPASQTCLCLPVLPYPGCAAPLSPSSRTAAGGSLVQVPPVSSSVWPRWDWLLPLCFSSGRPNVVQQGRIAVPLPRRV